MKSTNLMRTLSSRNCSKIFSAKLNKAFDEAINNGSAELVDANNDLAIANIGDDIVVEDKINDEVTKFTPNPEVENDMVMEAIDETTPETEEYCNARRYSAGRRTRRYSDTEEPMATENYKNTPVVGLSSDTHEIDTLPEVEVVVNEGVIDNEKSGTIPFSIKFRGVSRNRMYSISKAIKKAFSDEEAEEANTVNNAINQNLVNNITNAVETAVNNVVNEAVEEIKTESRRAIRKFSEGEVSNDTAEAIVNAVVNEVKNVLNEKLSNTENVKTESRTRRYSDEENNTANNAVDNAVDNAVNNAANNTANSVEEVENIKNNIKEEVKDELSNDLEELVNEAVIEPKVNITEETEEVTNKAESKRFSISRSNDQLIKCLTYKF